MDAAAFDLPPGIFEGLRVKEFDLVFEPTVLRAETPAFFTAGPAVKIIACDVNNVNPNPAALYADLIEAGKVYSCPDTACTSNPTRPRASFGAAPTSSTLCERPSHVECREFATTFLSRERKRCKPRMRVRVRVRVRYSDQRRLTRMRPEPAWFSTTLLGLSAVMLTSPLPITFTMALP